MAWSLPTGNPFSISPATCHGKAHSIACDGARILGHDGKTALVSGYVYEIGSRFISEDCDDFEVSA